ncbi:hypothetical protein KYK29_10500 [Shinella daejeonensis]|uniref:hypothetical protein n=1 Tax=Shinella daejeonensis TaxID=659017 RepID=UPI0020C7CB0A|nr:hypothetical protein [Shinella daejeonensis]MCP8895364.1 hypothetical protein [Shinella daejeonensis]
MRRIIHPFGFVVGASMLAGCVTADLPDAEAEKVADAYMGCTITDFFKRNSGKNVNFDDEVERSLQNCSSRRNALYQYGYRNTFSGRANVNENYRRLTAQKLIRESDKVIKNTIKDIVELKP